MSPHEKRKGWHIRQSFSDDFVDLMHKLEKKYGDKIFAIQGIANDHLDLVQFSRSFFAKSASNVADVSVDGNANVTEKNIMQYNYEAGKALMKLNSLYLLYKWVKKFWKREVAAEALEKVVNGELFVNDLVHFGMPYCYAFDLRSLLTEGMNFYKGNMPINPPKRSDSFFALLIQTTAYISNQILGAASYPDFFVVLDWFYRKEMGEDYSDQLNDKTIWKRIKNQFQNLVFSFNFPFRGNQSAFTNLSVMDEGFLQQLFGKGAYTYPDGTDPKLESVLKLSKKFFEYYAEINGKEGIFTFPVMTLAISIDKDTGKYIDPEFVDWAAKANCSKAMANIFQSVPNSFSSCCRLKSEFQIDEVGADGYQNSFGVGGLSIGSHRVAGLNLPRIAILEKENPNILEEDIELLHKILLAHRRLIQHHIDNKALPLYETGWIHLKKQYSTIGFVGGYEYVVNKGLNIKSDEGIKALTDVLTFVESKIGHWQREEKEDGNIYNIEQIPAESMAVRLAKIDHISGHNPKNFKLYSNQYIPLIEDASIYDRFRIQGNIDALTSGGAILHLNIDDEKPLSAKQFRKVIEHAKNSGTVYFAVNYAYSECEKKHYVVGKRKKCPVCKAKITQQYTRVVGFVTPVRSWNSVRRDYEYENRVFYSNENAVNGTSKKKILKPQPASV